MVLRGDGRPPTASRSRRADAVDAHDRRSASSWLHAILLLSPPLQLNDVFNYLGYARLGASASPQPVHARDRQASCTTRCTASRAGTTCRSPYGPLFTAPTYPLAFLSLPVAYWVLKIVTVLASLAFIGWFGTVRSVLGRDPRFAVLFVAANPIFLMYEVAGFHNDFFMLVPSIGAIALLLARRDRGRRRGADDRRRGQVHRRAAAPVPADRRCARRAAICDPDRRGARARSRSPRSAWRCSASRMPNLADQSTLLTDFSVPNLVGVWRSGWAARRGCCELATVALVASVIYLLRRRRRLARGRGLGDARADPQPRLAGALVRGLAAAAGRRWARASAAPRGARLTVYLVIDVHARDRRSLLSRHGIDPMGSPAGQASLNLQHGSQAETLAG